MTRGVLRDKNINLDEMNEVFSRTVFILLTRIKNTKTLVVRCILEYFKFSFIDALIDCFLTFSACNVVDGLIIFIILKIISLVLF